MQATKVNGWFLKELTHNEISPWYNEFEWALDSEEREVLRKESGLEEELQTLTSEWEQIVHCMDWVHHLSEHQGFKESSDLTALGLLNGAKEGSITFRCVEFSYMLQHVLSAFGFPSRVIGLKKENSHYGLGKGHVVAEVWSNEFSKWVILDPQMNVYYLNKQGTALSAIEIHDLVRAGKYDELVLSKEEEYRNSHVLRSAKDNKKIEELSVPEGYSKEDVWEILPETGDFDGFWTFWKSYYYQFTIKTSYELNQKTSPWVSKQYYYYAPEDVPPMMFQRMVKNSHYTNNRNRLYPALNAVEIQWAVESSDPQSNDKIELNLTHSMPWFEHYSIKVNHLSNHLISKDNLVTVPIINGDNIIEVTPINDLGRKGRTSTISFTIS